MLTTRYLFLSFPSNTLIATRISECPADFSTWTTAYHLKLNLNKTELLLMPTKDSPHMDLLVTVENITVSPSPTSRNLCVVLDNKLCCPADITRARSCRLALYKSDLPVLPSTSVPRHTSVPREIVRCAVGNFPLSGVCAVIKCRR